MCNSILVGHARTRTHTPCTHTHTHTHTHTPFAVFASRNSGKGNHCLTGVLHRVAPCCTVLHVLHFLQYVVVCSSVCCSALQCLLEPEIRKCWKKNCTPGVTSVRKRRDLCVKIDICVWKLYVCGNCMYMHYKEHTQLRYFSDVGAWKDLNVSASVQKETRVGITHIYIYYKLYVNPSHSRCLCWKRPMCVCVSTQRDVFLWKETYLCWNYIYIYIYMHSKLSAYTKHVRCSCGTQLMCVSVSLCLCLCVSVSLCFCVSVSLCLCASVSLCLCVCAERDTCMW